MKYFIRTGIVYLIGKILVIWENSSIRQKNYLYEGSKFIPNFLILGEFVMMDLLLRRCFILTIWFLA